MANAGEYECCAERGGGGRREVAVLKFGGTSLASAARVRLAARRVRAHVRCGRQVVVVVSAAGRSTDRILARLARCVLPTGEPVTGMLREADRALATGEDRSAALLAAALWSCGVPALSLRGGEAGVHGGGEFGAGRITAVHGDRLQRALADGVVPVVAGYQAARADGETITLGRGGSDTSAVALAAALGAECHIITDVTAVFDRDPHLHGDARPLRVLDHGTLLRLAEAGAHVVHAAAARMAIDAGVPLRVYHYRARLARAGTFVRGGTAAAAFAGGGR